MFKKKIIPFIFIFVILISLLCVPVSAVSADTNYNFYTCFSSTTLSLDGYFSGSDTTVTSLPNENYIRISYDTTADDVVDSVGTGLCRVILMFKLNLPERSSNESLNFSFSFRPNFDYLSIYNVTGAEFGIFSQGIKCGTCNINDSNGRCYVNVSNFIGENVFTLSIMCNVNSIPPGDIFHFYIVGPKCSVTNSVIQNQNDNASDIQSNQDENTQSIIDNQNDLYEQEKDEITDSGNQATDAADSIPNESAGFISALGGLISALSYNGTECAWTFPEIKLPAISGVMGEMVLSEEKPIDFSFWVEKMPSNILTLIRSITTIALVVYCFKELYSTISYVLTLKGGGE